MIKVIEQDGESGQFVIADLSSMRETKEAAVIVEEIFNSLTCFHGIPPLLGL